MKIFISWSGEKGRRVAKALKSFLQDVNQQLLPWFSDSDIMVGQRWGMELGTQLEATNYGIVCVTRESLSNPWPMFEAGALSKSVKGGTVCPYLVDLTRPEVVGPLSQFQSKEANQDQTWELLQSINISMREGALAEPRLKRYFGIFWPSLEEEINLANRDLLSLPAGLRKELLETLPRFLYRTQQIEMHAFSAGLPVWEVNLNQAAIHVWREMIQVATRHRKVPELMAELVQHYAALQDLNDKVLEWRRSLGSDAPSR
jgi:hypothetical protein